MLRVAHLAVPDTLVRVLQSPTFPSLGEASTSRASPTPFVVVSDGNDTILCSPAEQLRTAMELARERNDVEAFERARRAHELVAHRDGDRFMIETNVLQRQFAGITAQPKLVEDSATMFKSSLVKVMVSSCDGSPTRRIIDPGYPITVRGPRARLAILAPFDAVDLDRGIGVTLGGETPQLEESFEIDIYARACPLPCYTPPSPQLTWWILHEGGEPDADFVAVVPRGARRLVCGDFDANVIFIEFWQGVPGSAASQMIGVQTIAPAIVIPLDVPIFGSPTHIRFQSPPLQPGQMYMRWEID